MRPGNFEAMHLASPEGPRLVTIRTQVDYTERMLDWTRRRLLELEREDLCGFIFKSGSPSSGMERVKIYHGKGEPARTGVGIFAREFMQHFPLLPVEDEGRLHDPGLRENFLERLFTMKRWRETVALGARLGHLVDFHTRHKLLIMAAVRNTTAFREVGAQVKKCPPKLRGNTRLLNEGLAL
jgi:hypothetical protein